MFVGRQYETRLIQERLNDQSKAQMIILYGRRRVGKSTLIRKNLQHLNQVLYFEGIQGASTKEQINQFLTDLSKQTGRIKLAANNWREVFQGIEEIIYKGRWILVFDEFPWMAAGRTQLVSDIKLYWDRWSQNKEIVLFLCGSVTSFMVKHLIHSKALHNRKTLEIQINPLSPKESAEFISKRSLWEKAQLYMTFGGIPKYLEQINSKQSLERTINQLCFCSSGFFVNEFETLFKEQFKAIHTYESIARCLARQSMSITDISKETKIAKGGGLKEHLENLIQASFVRNYTPYKPNSRPKTRTKIYKLVDPFLIFYFRYMEPNRRLIERNRQENLFHSITGKSIHQYYGFAFERFCEDSMDVILEALGLTLSDIMNAAPYFQQKDQAQGGVQIDHLLMRHDLVWTILEYKYSTKPIGISIVNEIQQKINRLPVPQKITVEKVLIASAGVTAQVKESNFFNSILTLSDLL